MKPHLAAALPGNRAQGEQLHPSQVENSAGGYVWPVGPLERLRRFLILGTEGGSYYAGERTLTHENVMAVATALAELGADAVDEIVAVSTSGRAPKNDEALLVLALAASLPDRALADRALRAVPDVCRTGTHLFTFVAYLDAQRGWGSAARRAVAAWYEHKAPAALAYQLVKYRQRGGWTHRDVLRLCHPKAPTDDHRFLYDLACGRLAVVERGGTLTYRASSALRVVEGYVAAQKAETPAESGELVRRYGLTREMVRDEHLAEPEVWQAMLETDLPLTALIRNLGNMSRIGLLVPGSDAADIVADRLGDIEDIRSARVHPLTLLTALSTYASGHGYRGAGTWSPVGQVVDALDAAFYRAFDTVEATGLRYLIGLDVSGSMSTGSVAGSPLTPREAACALAMVHVAAEHAVEVVAFTANGWNYGGPRAGGGTRHHGGVEPFPISARQRLDDVCARGARLPFGGTDCALPMLYAVEHMRDVDVFVVLTDSETWAGGVHPSEALKRYRRESGIDAKLAVVGLVSNGFSIADPSDKGMLDVVGFDTAAPAVIAEFAKGTI